MVIVIVDKYTLARASMIASPSIWYESLYVSVFSEGDLVWDYWHWAIYVYEMW